jgi:hypothetical protein
MVLVNSVRLSFGKVSTINPISLICSGLTNWPQKFLGFIVRLWVPMDTGVLIFTIDKVQRNVQNFFVSFQGAILLSQPDIVMFEPAAVS